MSQIEVNEMLGLVCDVTTKVAAYNTMPGWVVFLVKFLLDVCSNILKKKIYI